MPIFDQLTGRTNRYYYAIADRNIYPFLFSPSLIPVDVPFFCVPSMTLHFQGELSMGSSFLVLLSWYKGAPLSPIHKLSVDQAVMRHGRTLTERQL